MKIMVNASNLRQGGGIQVADSICRLLNLFPQHMFIVVLPNTLRQTGADISLYSNVAVYYYEIRNYVRSFFSQRDSFLDHLVEEHEVNVVLTVFGPSRWNPKVKHLCGFARAQVLPMDTPYFKNLSFRERVQNFLVRQSFRINSDYYWTENPSVSELLKKLFPRKHVFTISNSYNQVFDCPGKWVEHILPSFNGTTILTITNYYPHKNLTIAIKIASFLKSHYPSFKFRFVFTIDKDVFPVLDDGLLPHFLFVGSVPIDECPSLYSQADIMFQPSLIECFTSTYPEAMKMKVPIVTTDLSFSRGLCGNAALYYSALSSEDAGESIYRLASNDCLKRQLINNGLKRLGCFMSAEQRVRSLVDILTCL